MSLNIKNERVHRLVREAAARTGLSQTSVIEEALRRYLAELDDRQAASRGRIAEILDLVDAQLSDSDRSEMLEVLEGLYDEKGLPR
ncbi:MAG TPA: type II toxin-antitoxin system VapB family antitoxin [Propionibacteriaceae bacterium]|nr:type II toxin-antitoxin system VapB family antitoxin [Propionibacteriaceae bacterium]